jgi:SAM-dependent methyltransferase
MLEHVVVPDPIFGHPRLAAIYDFIDDDRSDLDAHVGIVEKLGARSVLDIGCGTGTFACRLANSGKRVIGLDPARASLDVARHKPGAEQVRWVHGNVSHLPALSVDLASMTGNVAQVFLTDSEWAQVLAAVRTAVRPGGWLVFETRDPSRRAWESWTKNETYRRVAIPHVGLVDTWIELIQASFRTCRSVTRSASGWMALSSRPTRPFDSARETRLPRPSMMQGSVFGRSVRHRTGPVASSSSSPSACQTAPPEVAPTVG